MDTYTQPVVGWRMWKVDDKADLLRSTFMAYSWPADTAEAKHLGHVGPMAMGFVPPGGKVLAASLREAPGCKPPSVGHMCGFNAYSSLEVAYERNRRPVARWQNFPVFGAIVGFGRVVLHEQGFRSSKAQVVCLVEEPPLQFFPQESHPDLDAAAWLERMRNVAEAYDVPFLPHQLAIEYVASEGVNVEDYLA